MGFTFDPRANHGENCRRCDGTGQVSSAKDIPQSVRELVRDRSGGICEVCHVHPATDQHHRKYRSRQGTHVVENLIDICGPGNAFGCHGDAHGPEPLEGVSINSWIADPADVPFTDRRGERWMLRADGTKERVSVRSEWRTT